MTGPSCLEEPTAVGTKSLFALALTSPKGHLGIFRSQVTPFPLSFRPPLVSN